MRGWIRWEEDGAKLTCRASSRVIAGRWGGAAGGGGGNGANAAAAAAAGVATSASGSVITVDCDISCAELSKIDESAGESERCLSRRSCSPGSCSCEVCVAKKSVISNRDISNHPTPHPANHARMYARTHDWPNAHFFLSIILPYLFY